MPSPLVRVVGCITVGASLIGFSHKNIMFGLFKKIFKKEKGDSPAIAPASPAAPAYSRTATPGQSARPASNPFSGGDAGAPATATPAPPSAPASRVAQSVAPSAAVQPMANGPGGASSTAVTLPLNEIVPGLTHEFQSLFETKKNPEVSFPLQTILPQLSTGRIRVAFGDLRNACPEGACKAGPEHDGKLVDLPLAKVLSRVNPAFLPRKTQRSAMNVPEDVTGLFGSLGEPLPTVTQSTKESTAPAVPRAAQPVPRAAQPTPAPEKPIAVPETPKAKAQQPPAIPKKRANQKKAVTLDDLGDIPSPFSCPPAADVGKAPEVAEPPVPAPQTQPAPAPESGPDLEDIPAIKFSLGDATPQPPTPKAVAPKSQPVQKPVVPAAPKTQAVAPVPKPVAPVHAPAVETVAKPTEPAPEVAAPQTLDDNFIVLPVAKAQKNWSEAVRGEIKQYNLGDAQFALPYSEVDLAMRKGKIVFPWKTLRSWISPVGGAPKSTECDDEELVLPLKMVAPLFLKQRQPRGKQRKVSIEEEIPDLFSGAPVEEPAPTAAQETAPASAPAKAAPAAQAPAAPAASPTPNISASNPAELVKRTADLPGVSGALLSMSDGLVVASQLPAPLVGETAAAFLPQIFGRLTQFSTELKLGELTSVMLVMDNSPWIIFRTEKVYFAVVGQVGKALPLPQLTAIVADIKRQNL